MSMSATNQSIRPPALTGPPDGPCISGLPPARDKGQHNVDRIFQPFNLKLEPCPLAALRSVVRFVFSGCPQNYVVPHSVAESSSSVYISLFIVTSLFILGLPCFRHVYQLCDRPCLPPPFITQFNRERPLGICHMLLSRWQYCSARYAVLIKWKLDLLRQRLCMPLQ
jgi:hypothetical protein